MRQQFAWLAIVALVFLTLSAYAGSVGMFGGKIVDGTAQNPPGKWIYVRGARATIRRVEISRAKLKYADSVPRASRAAKASDDLKGGALVQVAAEQDASGEWIGRSVLILRLSQQWLVESSARR
jgi:hypothetical protein